jgi:hypothetical protein
MLAAEKTDGGVTLWRTNSIVSLFCSVFREKSAIKSQVLQCICFIPVNWQYLLCLFGKGKTGMFVLGLISPDLSNDQVGPFDRVLIGDA